MKKLALVFVVALALLPFAAPASAADSSTVAPAATLEQILGPAAPVEMVFPPIIQRCSAVNGTSCSPTGSTRSCTDACNNQLSCTCTSAHTWRCSIEC
jgi:hypothetical protein